MKFIQLRCAGILFAVGQVRERGLRDSSVTWQITQQRVQLSHAIVHDDLSFHRSSWQLVLRNC